MVGSYGAARLAAVRGGKIRLLMPKSEPNNTTEGKFWTDFEAYQLTNSGSNVQEIWRFNSEAFDDAPVLIWKQGDPRIRNLPNFGTTIEDDPIENF
jgi:hypothetical protein